MFRLSPPGVSIAASDGIAGCVVCVCRLSLFGWLRRLDCGAHACVLVCGYRHAFAQQHRCFKAVVVYHGNISFDAHYAATAYGVEVAHSISYFCHNCLCVSFFLSCKSTEIPTKGQALGGYEIWDGEVWPVAETMFDTDNAGLGVVKPRYADCEPLRKMV